MSFDLNHGLAVLERTPATFRALLAGLPDVWITSRLLALTARPTRVVGKLLHP